MYSSAIVCLYSCVIVQLYKCTLLHACASVQLYSCTWVQLSMSTIVHVYNCTAIQLYMCTDVARGVAQYEGGLEKDPNGSLLHHYGDLKMGGKGEETGSVITLTSALKPTLW